MIRPDAQTTRPCAPDDRPAGCAAAHVYPLCGCDGRPRTTAPLPPPDAVAAYVAKRAAIVALRAECDALWSAMGEGDHDRVVTSLESLGLVG